MNRRGVALLLAVTSLAALGLVAMSGVLLATREAVLGQRALAGVRARGAADAALAEAFRGWPEGLTPFMPGDSVQIAAVSLPGAATGRVFLRALGGSVYALRATGATGTMLTQRVELLVQIDSSGTDSLARPRPIARGWTPIP